MKLLYQSPFTFIMLAIAVKMEGCTFVTRGDVYVPDFRTMKRFAG